ncbi:hypothetical protein PR202_ga19359 [Eleusine coracana subsp. coracana]|uniref:Amino acid transporter transmembrane domain-containing protein n=1 Tax=Eleusine coracana subsp. coracana TaxID=191504 RepID=A0AAV5CUV7_ELECO|nr:hypothetical protein PR202_ga19359 [Eleusine coracana subsp. coracana]
MSTVHRVAKEKKGPRRLRPSSQSQTHHHHGCYLIACAPFFLASTTKQDREREREERESSIIPHSPGTRLATSDSPELILLPVVSDSIRQGTDPPGPWVRQGGELLVVAPHRRGATAAGTTTAAAGAQRLSSQPKTFANVFHRGGGVGRAGPALHLLPHGLGRGLAHPARRRRAHLPLHDAPRGSRPGAASPTPTPRSPPSGTWARPSTARPAATPSTPCSCSARPASASDTSLFIANTLAAPLPDDHRNRGASLPAAHGKGASSPTWWTWAPWAWSLARTPSPGSPTARPSSPPRGPRSFLYGLGVAVYAFEGIGMVLPLEAEAADKRRFGATLALSMAFIAAMYGLFGAMGYLAFGADTRDIITTNLGTGWLSVAVQLGLCVNLFFTMPVMMNPVYEVAERLLCGKRYAWWLRWILVLLVGLSAMLVPNFADFLSLVGSSVCIVLGFVLPAAFHLKVFGAEIGSVGVVSDVAVVILGIALAVSGTWTSLLQIFSSSSSV